jgi:signal transduction histidine kinase
VSYHIRDKVQTEFINIAAHELRNPIQPIVGLPSLCSHALDVRTCRIIQESNS